MLDVVTSSYDNNDNHCYAGSAFADLRKAFDSVSHKTLLQIPRQLRYFRCGLQLNSILSPKQAAIILFYKPMSYPNDRHIPTFRSRVKTLTCMLF